MEVDGGVCVMCSSMRITLAVGYCVENGTGSDKGKGAPAVIKINLKSSQGRRGREGSEEQVEGVSQRLTGGEKGQAMTETPHSDPRSRRLGKMEAKRG